MFGGPTKPPMEKRVANTPHVQPGGIAHDLEHVEPSHKHASWFATDPSTLPAPPLSGNYNSKEHAFVWQERGLGSPVGSDDLEVTTDAWTTAVYGPQGCDKETPAVSLLTPSHLVFVDQVKFAPHLQDLHHAHEDLLARQERGLGSPVGSDDLEVTTDAWTTAVYGPQSCDKETPAVSLLTPSHLGFVDQVKFALHVP